MVFLKKKVKNDEICEWHVINYFNNMKIAVEKINMHSAITSLLWPCVPVYIDKNSIVKLSVGFGFQWMKISDPSPSVSIHSNPIFFTRLTREPTHSHPIFNLLIGFIEFGSVREILSTPKWYNICQLIKKYLNKLIARTWHGSHTSYDLLRAKNSKYSLSTNRWIHVVHFSFLA
jgi:hypothetical protein